MNKTAGIVLVVVGAAMVIFSAFHIWGLYGAILASGIVVVGLAIK